MQAVTKEYVRVGEFNIKGARYYPQNSNEPCRTHETPC